jgi:hypothetical protein
MSEYHTYYIVSRVVGTRKLGFETQFLRSCRPLQWTDDSTHAVALAEKSQAEEIASFFPTAQIREWLLSQT